MISLFRHFQLYGCYYVNLLLLPLLYNKITYQYSWNNLPIASTKFAFLYFITFLLQVFTTLIACFIQRWGANQVDDDQLKWRSVWYRLAFYVMPASIGLMVLVTFTFLWYEGHDLYPIMMQHAQSRFFIYASFFVLFTIWLDRNQKRNWFSAKFYPRIQYVVPNQEVQHHLSVLEHNETNAKLETMGMALEKATYVIENTAKSLLEQNMKVHDDDRVKGLYKEALNEFFADQPFLPFITPMHDDIQVKGLVKEAIQELGNLNDVILENLYASLYARSPSKLEPFFNASLEVLFYHIFAIESHTKSAAVILTDGTRIEADNILELLKEQGLLKWMCKMNRVYYINMMHVCIANPVDGKLVQVHALTLKSLELNLKKIEINTICSLGIKIKDSKIRAFLNSRSELRNEDWDTLVRLQK